MTVVDAEPGADRPMAVDEWVVRDRLLADLARSQRCPVVVMCGPPGAGKSTLAQQWQRHDPRVHATVRLAPHLDDPAALAELLVSAFARLGVPAPRTRAGATAAEPSFSAVLLPALERLASSPPAAYLLVVDDVHLMTDPACHAVLTALCDGVPRGSQVALLTRSSTPVWLAPARAAGRLHEVGPDDLAFDVDEGIRLFRDRGLHLPDAEVARLVDRAEGWAVALYLDTLAMRSRHRAATAVTVPRKGADRFLVDYLRSTVLASLDGPTREFLVRTSVLDELTAPLCDAVLERDDSGRVLPDLSDRLALVVDADHQRRTFRCHHLLAESLRAELVERYPQSVPDLHRRAAQWYAGRGDLDAAVRHAKESGDLGLTAALVWSGIVPTVGSGRPDRLRRWLDGLTDTDVAANPTLSLAAAWSGLQSADESGMTRWLLRSEEHAGRGWRARVADDTYCAELGVLVALIGRGGLDEIADLATRSREGLPADSGFRAPAAFLAGVALTLRRDLDHGQELLAEAEHYARALGVHIVEADSLSWQGLLAMLAGDWERGASLISTATEVIRTNHVDRLATAAHCITAQALAFAVRGRRDEAATALAKARRLTVDISGVAPWFHVTGRLVQARTAILLGDGATGRLLIRAAKEQMTADLATGLAADLLDDTEAALHRLAATGVTGVALTNAELRVLQFMPSYLSFPEIGEHLFLSRNTVKTHALSIYRKLGVTSRSEAVTRAQELGLVEAPVVD